MYKNAYNELDVISLYLGNYGGRFYLREISEQSKLPLRTTQIALSNLEDAGIVRSLVHGRNKYFILNPSNPATKLYLLQAEIIRTIAFLEKYPSFRMFLEGLGDAPIILFGSFAKFSAGKDSDADMIIVSEKEKIPTHLLPCEKEKLKDVL
ncbi:MAG: nucleotidyltransferase domain-containing protein, partial [Candidatus Aenigmatarchaeota archaeon]